jgi:hypothetical protein
MPAKPWWHELPDDPRKLHEGAKLFSRFQHWHSGKMGFRESHNYLQSVRNFMTGKESRFIKSIRVLDRALVTDSMSTYEAQLLKQGILKFLRAHFDADLGRMTYQHKILHTKLHETPVMERAVHDVELMKGLRRDLTELAEMHGFVVDEEQLKDVEGFAGLVESLKRRARVRR